jgi:hypothetical protein
MIAPQFFNYSLSAVALPSHFHLFVELQFWFVLLVFSFLNFIQSQKAEQLSD